MKRVIITLGDGGENIEPKISEVEDGWWDSLDPKSSEVNEEEVPFWFFPSILSLKKKKKTTLSKSIPQLKVRAFLYSKIHQNYWLRKALKWEEPNYRFSWETNKQSWRKERKENVREEKRTRRSKTRKGITLQSSQKLESVRFCVVCVV